jgi:predicted Kef-type K+ transport protein
MPSLWSLFIDLTSYKILDLVSFSSRAGTLYSFLNRSLTMHFWPHNSLKKILPSAPYEIIWSCSFFVKIGLSLNPTFSFDIIIFESLSIFLIIFYKYKLYFLILLQYKEKN